MKTDGNKSDYVFSFKLETILIVQENTSLSINAFLQHFTWDLFHYSGLHTKSYAPRLAIIVIGSMLSIGTNWNDDNSIIHKFSPLALFDRFRSNWINKKRFLWRSPLFYFPTNIDKNYITYRKNTNMSHPQDPSN